MKKPLGTKSYGSTAHLPGSNVGPGDHTCHIGQYDICCSKVRDKNDRILVTEKLDGSNVAVARIDDKLYALNRSGYLASDSPYKQHHAFDEWVIRNTTRLFSVLNNDERINLELMIQAHGTLYNIPHEPIIAFGLMHKQKKLCWDEVIYRTSKIGLITPKVIHDGKSISIDDVIKNIPLYGYHGATEPIEGIVYRVEYKGKLDFLAKYVRKDKINGKYLTNDINVPNEVPDEFKYMTDYLNK